MEVALACHNVTFTLFIEEEEMYDKYTCLCKQIENGMIRTMRALAAWCRGHGIKYKTDIRWREDYPIMVNLRNVYTYIGFVIEEAKITKGEVKELKRQLRNIRRNL